MKKLTGGLGLGGILALTLSIIDNCTQNNSHLDTAWQVIWVVLNTICGWFYVISYIVTHIQIF